MIALQGIDFEMPVEIETSEGVQRVPVGKKGVEVKSKTPPVVDPRGWLIMAR